MNKYLKKMLGLTLVVTMGLILVACGDSRSDGLEETGDLMADLHRNFGGEEADRGYDFAEPVWVPRDHVFMFDLTLEGVEGINNALAVPMEHDYLHDFERFIRIFRDPELTREIRYLPNFDDVNHEWISAEPLRADFSIAADLNQGELSDGWGNSGQYFLVQYIDFETGEMLERPLVTVFYIETEIDGRPHVRFDLNDDGIAGLVWEPVEGATRYAIVSSWEAYTEGGQALEITRLEAITSETYWHDDEGVVNSNFIIASPYDHLDHAFAAYMNSADSSRSVEEFMKQDWEFNHVQVESGIQFHSFHIGVIALDDDEGMSAVSNLIDIRSVAPQIPMMPAIYLNEGNFTRSTEGYLGTRGTFENDVLAVPTHTWVITTDGLASRFLIDYDVERIIEHGNVLRIPFRIEGTMFEGFAEIVDFNEETFEGELQVLAERQENLRPRTGGVLPQTPDFTRDADEASMSESTSTGEFTLQDVRRVGSPSPLTAYLALNMLNGESRIDLSAFPESADHQYVFDAWSEASLQNPLILGPRSAQIDWQNGYLLVTYDHDDAEERARQQQAIMERVDEIVEEIIEPGMTDLEMQTAINDWLVENVEYDFPALENAEQNNFMFVDPYFYNTFTAYGILINGIGVCSGYADAFVLIADRVGLESVFVTGFMNGSLPHAWNRVNLDDNWYTLDVTNNGLEHFPNAFFNLTDAEAALVLTEDNRWISDSQLPYFVARGDAPSEYYRYTGRFFSQSDIAEALAAGILRDGYAIYRTDMWLTEHQFRDIAFEVMDILGVPDLNGGFYLGIIYLEEVDVTANTGQTTNDSSTRSHATSPEEQALEMARWYLDIMPLSYEEVILLLELDGFANSAISAAMRELDREVDWYEQAEKRAFLFSIAVGELTEDELFDHLFRDAMFTRSQANHGVDSVLN